ncbi:IclR family transcriptional regulator [Sphingomonas sp. PP-F2F-A104-K0414]|uniref:IclR family transcriptional regulator n=1 Tax=Sphingomonas sp. PP-F2F-A104-K0414 TaxID=2135661 RepID=UPI00104FA03A|nr:IclR family transcriptional regulator [Sphingomonas sp. PP-F2F-A104-K0414]TCP97402.1 IclR family transcriptional regulator [Sphingomonas sp. PP-F2F-A104-K0414]
MDQDGSKDRGIAGSQTLMRGLDVMEAVARGQDTLPRLADTLGLSRSTAHRIASALVERGYLAFTPREGYRLGAQLLALGHQAQEQADIVQVARPHIETLAAMSEDTVHLGVIDTDLALYLDKVPGRRRITISSRVGDRHPLSSTGLGKALMLDHPPAYWDARLAAEQAKADGARWHDRMMGYVDAGRAFDLEENEDQIRCVAAPIRDATGTIVAAISVSSAAQYMDDDRMQRLGDDVRATARVISIDLGWTDKQEKGNLA